MFVAEECNGWYHPTKVWATEAKNVLMAPRRLPKGENTAGLNPDGTLAIGTPDQMRPLLEQWKRWQEMYERGEIPDEPVLAVQPAATTR